MSLAIHGGEVSIPPLSPICGRAVNLPFILTPLFLISACPVWHHEAQHPARDPASPGGSRPLGSTEFQPRGEGKHRVLGSWDTQAVRGTLCVPCLRLENQDGLPRMDSWASFVEIRDGLPRMDSPGWTPGHPLGCTQERGEQGTSSEVVTTKGGPGSVEIGPNSISEKDTGAEPWV